MGCDTGRREGRPVRLRGSFVERGQSRTGARQIVSGLQLRQDRPGPVEQGMAAVPVSRSASKLGSAHQRLGELVPRPDLLEDAGRPLEVNGRATRIVGAQDLAEQTRRDTLEVPVASLATDG